MRSMIAVLTLLVVVFTIGEAVNHEKYSQTIQKVAQNGQSFRAGLEAELFKNYKTNDCWQCSGGCTAVYCCDDGYPQCCIVTGKCGCCPP
ncbi:unnamed protein product [Oppiella nova]|uniref:Uncharacterized protein n=1 Tax=Oppiella nova TaxID=334625 RepID=A0A7R9M335_9ACAR|nr:unnamed protein product [Oppiella nova]CAG2169842.1 unnamed protein product [Oppiella nova]